MSTKLRYMTLLQHTSRIYACQESGRFDLLQTGLTEIAAIHNDQWDKVSTDSKRLLTIWSAKEDTPLASIVMTQLMELLDEPPALMVSEAPSAADRIIHIGDGCYDDDESVCSSIEEHTGAVVLMEESIPLPEVPSESIPMVLEVEEEEAEEEEEEEEAEEEEEEEESEEEVEEAMEVEQIFIRGRSYWHEPATKKLYALVGEEDVGDEVGVMVDGKPRFLVPS